MEGIQDDPMAARPRSRSRFGSTSAWWKPPSKKAGLGPSCCFSHEVFDEKKNRGLGDFDEIELKEKNLMSLVVEILVVQERVELKSSQS